MRTGATLADLAAVLGGQRLACVARELTKPFEEFVRGTLEDLAARYRDDRPLGEITLVVAGTSSGAPPDGEELDDDELAARVDRLLADGQSARDVADALAAATGRPRRAIYQLVVERAGKDEGGD
jgi:16S rRNA (cytidine1402-2'-O)-methyltransferase